MFHSDSRNSSYALKSVFSKERVLVKAQILDSQATDPKSRTVLLTRTHQRTNVENFSSLGGLPAEK
jgi:hypothetical protein